MEFHPFHILSNFFVVCLCVIFSWRCIMKLRMSKSCCYLSSLKDAGETRALPSNSVRDWDSAKFLKSFFAYEWIKITTDLAKSNISSNWRKARTSVYISIKYTPSYIVYKYIPLQNMTNQIQSEIQTPGPAVHVTFAYRISKPLCHEHSHRSQPQKPNRLFPPLWLKIHVQLKALPLYSMRRQRVRNQRSTGWSPPRRSSRPRQLQRHLMEIA